MFERGNANWGVPQRKRFASLTRRGRQAAAPALTTRRCFLSFLDFSFDQVALQHAEVLQKKNSVEVIDLMAKRSRQQVPPRISNASPLAFCAYRHKLRPQHVTPKTRNR